MYPNIRKLLAHSDPGVRARVCNLVGNMCRHSAYFYSALDRHGLIQPLIDRCQDQVEGRWLIPDGEEGVGLYQARWEGVGSYSHS